MKDKFILKQIGYTLICTIILYIMWEILGEKYTTIMVLSAILGMLMARDTDKKEP